MDQREFATALAKRMADEGKVIEAGWITFRAAVVPRDAPEIQVREMMLAFMAGAAHLFGMLTFLVDDDEDPSVGDLERMESVQRELQGWNDLVKRRAGL